MGMTDKQFAAYVQSLRTRLRDIIHFLFEVDDPKLKAYAEEKLKELENELTRALED